MFNPSHIVAFGGRVFSRSNTVDFNNGISAEGDSVKTGCTSEVGVTVNPLSSTSYVDTSKLHSGGTVAVIFSMAEGDSSRKAFAEVELSVESRLTGDAIRKSAIAASTGYLVSGSVETSRNSYGDTLSYLSYGSVVAKRAPQSEVLTYVVSGLLDTNKLSTSEVDTYLSFGSGGVNRDSSGLTDSDARIDGDGISLRLKSATTSILVISGHGEVSSSHSSDTEAILIFGRGDTKGSSATSTIATNLLSFVSVDSHKVTSSVSEVSAILVYGSNLAKSQPQSEWTVEVRSGSGLASRLSSSSTNAVTTCILTGDGEVSSKLSTGSANLVEGRGVAAIVSRSSEVLVYLPSGSSDSSCEQTSNSVAYLAYGYADGESSQEGATNIYLSFGFNDVQSKPSSQGQSYLVYGRGVSKSNRIASTVTSLSTIASGYSKFRPEALTSVAVTGALGDTGPISKSTEGYANSHLICYSYSLKEKGYVEDAFAGVDTKRNPGGSFTSVTLAGRGDASRRPLGQTLAYLISGGSNIRAESKVAITTIENLSSITIDSKREYKDTEGGLTHRQVNVSSSKFHESLSEASSVCHLIGSVKRVPSSEVSVIAAIGCAVDVSSRKECDVFLEFGRPDMYYMTAYSTDLMASTYWLSASQSEPPSSVSPPCTLESLLSYSIAHLIPSNLFTVTDLLLQDTITHNYRLGEVPTLTEDIVSYMVHSDIH